MKKSLYIALFLFAPLVAFSQAQRTTEEFIVDVLSNKVNPFAYFPFNRELFLPNEEMSEREKIFEKSSVILIQPSDSTFSDRTFVDAYGAPMKLFVSPKDKKFDTKDTPHAFASRKQQYHLRQYPNMGRFLYFFSARK